MLMDYLDKYKKNIENINELEKDDDEITISRRGAIEFYKLIRELLFFKYYYCEKVDANSKISEIILKAKQIFNRFKSDCSCIEEDNPDFDVFFDSLPELKSLLMKDVKAIYDGDPACQNYSEVILTYPGFVAISAYRIAHKLYLMDYKFIARIIAEYAHSRTGIDINPGATIGEYFFIDHGTGIVIGETCIIGNHVKIYQGVTLGALSLKEGQNLKGKRRHPQICDNVTIYSSASIFGGDTVIGENSIIGSSAFITKSVPANSLVRNKPFDIEIIQKIKK